jgi:hypothetical protein
VTSLFGQYRICLCELVCNSISFVIVF